MLLKEKKDGRLEVMGWWGRRCKQLLDDLREMKGYWKLKQVASDHSLWGTHFGRGHGPVIRQTMKWVTNWKCTLNEPSVFMHWAFWSQPPLLVRHSLTSLQLTPLPVKPSRQRQKY